MRPSFTEEQAAELESGWRRLMLENKPWKEATLSLDIVARMLGTTSRHVSTMLSLRNKSFRGEMRRLRLQEARRLLEEDPSLGNAAVAARSGLGSPSNLAVLFRDAFGVTTQEFRQSVLQAKDPSFRHR